MLLIPAIDLRGGRCVRLYQGDFGAETRYEYSPRELLEKYRALGASWVHVVDLDGARDGVLANREVIVDLAAQRSLKLQVGGRMRSWAGPAGSERIASASPSMSATTLVGSRRCGPAAGDREPRSPCGRR